MDIKDFFEEIDPGLLKYASAFHKCGFSSSVTMKYWCEQDFQNLGVEVPEGHQWLILNMVITKIRTPKLKSGENRSFIPLNHVISDILGQLRPYLFIENIPTNSKTFKPWRESLLNGCKTSNVWLPSMSCLHPIRTCFSITCPRLDENDGIHVSTHPEPNQKLTYPTTDRT